MKLFFKIAAGLLTVVILFISFALFRFAQFSNQTFKRPEFTISEEVKAADVALGQRIFHVRNGCVDCHGADLSGAKIMEDPAMGSIHGANLTPYKMNSWSDEDIAAAIRYGVHKDGRSLYFMPSTDFENLSKTDIAALIAYIRSVPEVVKENHPNTFGPIARVMAGLNKMPVMFPALHIDQTKGFSEKPTEGPTKEFGHYLAHSCTGCHGPNFEGGKIPGGDPAWPKASNIRLGADASWTEENFKQLIATGVSPKSGQPIRAPMPVALLKQMNETEVKALWLFLSELK